MTCKLYVDIPVIPKTFIYWFNAENQAVAVKTQVVEVENRGIYGKKKSYHLKNDQQRCQVLLCRLKSNLQSRINNILHNVMKLPTVTVEYVIFILSLIHRLLVVVIISHSKNVRYLVDDVLPFWFSQHIDDVLKVKSKLIAKKHYLHLSFHY